MLRTVIRLHTGILVVAGLALLIVPGFILAAFDVANPTFPILALTRILAGLLIVLAAAVAPVAQLPNHSRSNALSLIAAAYALLSALCLVQQLSIWSSVAGALLSFELILHALVFAWLAVLDRRSLAVEQPGT